MSDKHEHINEKSYSENDEGEWGARFLRPLSSSAHIAYAMESPTNIPLAELTYGMERMVEAMNKNDVQAIQEILLPQAIALQTIFEKASRQMLLADSFNGLQSWSAIAFKAQEQSRKTIATLMAIRQPRQVAFIKQQNNAINQQVNNAKQDSNPVNFDRLSNELLSGGQYEVLDRGRASQAITGDTALETMEMVDRRKD